MSAQVLERAQASGIRGLIVAGVDPEGWVRQAAMSQPWVWHAFGLHPWRAAAMTHSEIDEALAMLTHHLDANAQRTVGLGETGLDKSKRCPSETLDPQVHAFRAQVTITLGVTRCHAKVKSENSPVGVVKPQRPRVLERVLLGEIWLRRFCGHVAARVFFFGFFTVL